MSNLSRITCELSVWCKYSCATMPVLLFLSFLFNMVDYIMEVFPSLNAGSSSSQFFVFFRRRSRNRLILTFCVSMKSECRGHHFFYYIYVYIYLSCRRKKSLNVSLSKEILVDVACPWPDHMVLFSKSLKTFQVLPVERLNHKWETNLSRFST